MGVTSVDRGNYKKAANRPFPSFRSVMTERYKYTETYETDGQIPILFDHETDPGELVNQHGKAPYTGIEAELKAILNAQHTIDEWAEIVVQDGERAKEYRDGIKPSMPNQYMLKDGRIFDAEKSLYDARWLQTSNENIYAGYIPQRRH